MTPLFGHCNASLNRTLHYSDVIMSAMASQITSLTIVCSTIYSGADQRKHQSSAPLAFVRGIHRGPVNSPHKWPITRKMFPFDDFIMDVSELTDVPWGYGSNFKSMTYEHISQVKFMKTSCEIARR